MRNDVIQVRRRYDPALLLALSAERMFGQVSSPGPAPG
jgi:hypothetical protein